jgi:hypothetical protein
MIFLCSTVRAVCEMIVPPPNLGPCTLLVLLLEGALNLTACSAIPTFEELGGGMTRSCSLSPRILYLHLVLTFFMTLLRSTVRVICGMIDCCVPPPNLGPCALLVLLILKVVLNLIAGMRRSSSLGKQWRHDKVLLRLAGSLFESFTCI